MKRSTALYFSESDLQLARDNRDREPVRCALALLDTRPADPLDAASLHATRYRLHRDQTAGDRAMAALLAQDFSNEAALDLPQTRRCLGWLTVLGMLRDHAQWAEALESSLRPIVSMVNRRSQSDSDDGLEHLLWLAAATMAAGVLIENADSVEQTASVYRRMVDQSIHPEGYFKGIVDLDGATDTFAAQFAATGALVLMAEMAQRAGVDLWNYSNRAVSINTAATYTFYYYFFPERWRWEDNLTREKTMETMRRDGAFFEMVNRRNPLRGVEQLFAEQRPMFSATGGGLTTLTHGLALPRKKRWRLW